MVELKEDEICCHKKNCKLELCWVFGHQNIFHGRMVETKYIVMIKVVKEKLWLKGITIVEKK